LAFAADTGLSGTLEWPLLKAGSMRFLVLSLLLILSGVQGFAANVSLAWDPSPDTNVVRYYVYYGTGTGDYTNRVSAENATTVTVSNLTVGSTYFFAATAFSDSGLESDFSNEVSYTVPASEQPVVILLSSLEQVFDGTPRQINFTTAPDGVACQVTYNGQSAAPVNAGAYAVEVSANSAGYTGTVTGTLVITKAPATVTLANLEQLYSGSACVVTANTVPAGLPVTLTYNGSSSAPTAAGSYTVAATIDSTDYVGAATGTLVIAKAPAAVTLANLEQVYSGNPCSVTATTVPAGLPVTVTYNGAAVAPIEVGSYAVAALIDSPNYTGTSTGTLVITSATAPITSEVSLAWDPSPDANVVRYYVYYGVASGDYTNRVDAGNATSVTISNLVVGCTYYFAATAMDDSGLESDFSNEVSYTVPAPKQPAAITLTQLQYVYDGLPKTVSAAVTPPELSYSVTYNGSATAPVAAGAYTVIAEVTSEGYTGTAMGTLVIAQAQATVTLANLEQVYSGTASAATVTTVPSGLPVTVTYNGSTTVPTAVGTYAVVASVASTNYTGSATGTLVIVKAPAQLFLSNLAQRRSGSSCPVKVTTFPGELPVQVTYDGAPAAPSEVGTYTVTANVDHDCYEGSISGTLTVRAPSNEREHEITVSWDPSSNIPASQVQVVQAINLTDWVPGTVAEFGTNYVILVSETPAAFFRASAGGNQIPVHVQITSRQPVE
jgi:uncharacterized protein YqjF (DUF2071 family)